jgi:hypothetical protein
MKSSGNAMSVSKIAAVLAGVSRRIISSPRRNISTRWVGVNDVIDIEFNWTAALNHNPDRETGGQSKLG